MKDPIGIRSLYAKRRVRVLQKIPFFVREIKRNHSFLKRNREGGEGGTRISRVSRGKKNRIGISISFQSEIKGRLNADTLRSIEGRVDIAAWKITEGARGRRVRRGSRGKRTWKTNGRRGKGEGEDEREARKKAIGGGFDGDR